MAVKTSVIGGSIEVMKFPGLYYAAETASAQNQRKFLVARASEFTAFALAAFFGELPGGALWRTSPVFAFTFFLIALIIRLSGVGDKAEKRWYDARAVSESVKSSSWQYSAGGEAFRINDAAASDRFVESLREMLKTLSKLDVAVSPEMSFAITPEMKTLRNSTRSIRAKEYLKGRVKDQVAWYAEKAQWNKKRATRWRRILIIVEFSAVTLGGLRMFGIFDLNWLGVFAAVAAGIAAWQQTKNYSSLSEAYAVTSHEATLVSSTLSAQNREDVWAQAVHDAEAAFSREHTLWLARKQGPKGS